MIKSFQNKGRTYLTVPSKKCTHHRNSYTYIQYEERENIPTRKFTQQKENIHNRQSSQPVEATTEDPHSLVIKSLVAMNQNYFRNKLQVGIDGRPRQLKLSIPSKTGWTIYKRDYIKKSYSQAQMIPKFKQNQIDGVLFGNTTYHDDFLGKQQTDQAQRVNWDHLDHSDGPRFMETQYRHNYQNWGADGFMPNMAPKRIAATTNLPFQAVSIYASDFAKKPGHKKGSRPYTSVTAFNASDSTIISSNLTSPLLYRTTSNAFFDIKNIRKENSHKPKHYILKMGQFKGKTEYQDKFIKVKHTDFFQQSSKKPLGELQNLIINL